jgi:peptide/nickel transport system permease protein
MSAPAVAVQGQPQRARRVLARTARWSRANPITALGFAILILLALVSVLAPVIAPHNPNAFDPNAVDKGPSWNHLFGTGTFGEDIFSRVLYGGRIDLLIGFGAVAVGLVLGSTLGAVAGYFRDPVDEIVMRIMDMIAAFPTFILAMGVAAAIGPSTQNLVFAIALTNVPIYARLMRARFLVVRESQYALAAVSVGSTRRRILWWHLLPNTWEPIFVQSTLQFGWAILDAAGLSFIGLGIRLPTPEWGVMVSLGVERIVSGEWWISFFPGMAIAVAVMACNLIGDGLRDLLDPRRR